MKHTVKLFLFMEQFSNYEKPGYPKEWKPDIWSFKPQEEEGRVFVREFTTQVDVPDDFDPVPRQVAALEKKKAEALEAYQQTVATINKRLSELQAIGCDA